MLTIGKLPRKMIQLKTYITTKNSGKLSIVTAALISHMELNVITQNLQKINTST